MFVKYIYMLQNDIYVTKMSGAKGKGKGFKIHVKLRKAYKG